MNEGAHVGSIAAVREFRAALCTFAHDARDALVAFDTESRRSLEWLFEAVPKHWREELRRAEEAVTQARIDLERARNSRLPGGEPRSCLAERKALERARGRRQYVEEKIQKARHWAAVASRESKEYQGRAHQLEALFDEHVPRALAQLDRVLATLESYVAAGNYGPNRFALVTQPPDAESHAIASAPSDAADERDQTERECSETNNAADAFERGSKA